MHIFKIFVKMHNTCSHNQTLPVCLLYILTYQQLSREEAVIVASESRNVYVARGALSSFLFEK